MTPRLQRRVREAHPEVSFALLNGAPLLFAKKSADGEAERRGLLNPIFGEIRGVPGAARDDVLDAYALLWSARRARRGKARVLGGDEGGARGREGGVVRWPISPWGGPTRSPCSWPGGLRRFPPGCSPGPHARHPGSCPLAR